MFKTPIVTPVETSKGIEFDFEQRVLVTKPVPLSEYRRDPRLSPDVVEVVAPDAKLACVGWRLSRSEVEQYIQELQELLDVRQDV
jgi:hypothetical protein